MTASIPDVVIWDFNGTLIDDVSLALDSINRMLARRGLPVLGVEAYRKVFGFPLADYYRKIGIDPSRETATGLADEFHAGYLLGLPTCSLHDGVLALLDRLEKHGVRQFVLSAMEEEALIGALRRLGIEAKFDAVHGLGHRLADSKIERGRELIRRFGIRPERALLIGDTDHDAEVAGVLGTSVALVAGGHQSADRLLAFGPVFEDLDELRGALFAAESAET